MRGSRATLILQTLHETFFAKFFSAILGALLPLLPAQTLHGVFTLTLALLFTPRQPHFSQTYTCLSRFSPQIVVPSLPLF